MRDDDLPSMPSVMICPRCNRLMKDNHDCRSIVTLILLFDMVMVIDHEYSGDISVEAERGDLRCTKVITRHALETYKLAKDEWLADALLELDRRMSI